MEPTRFGPALPSPVLSSATVLGLDWTMRRGKCGPLDGGASNYMLTTVSL